MAAIDGAVIVQQCKVMVQRSNGMMARRWHGDASTAVPWPHLEDSAASTSVRSDKHRQSTLVVAIAARGGHTAKLIHGCRLYALRSFELLTEHFGEYLLLKTAGFRGFGGKPGLLPNVMAIKKSLGGFTPYAFRCFCA